jgi:iron complex transport system substrate-binding protein
MKLFRLHPVAERLEYSLVVFFFLFMLVSCREAGIKEGNELNQQGNEIRVAGRISIEKKDKYTRVTISDPWQGAHNVTMDYYLVRRGEAIPDGLDSSRVIPVPIRNIICMSTTHVAMIEVLGEEKSISGISGPGYLYSPELRHMAQQGLIKDVGYESNLNKELILNINPDLLMIYGVGSESAGYVGKLRELGIKVMYNADYLETNPVGRAEWIKLFGALYCREAMSDSLFNSEEEAYEKLKLQIRSGITDRPVVLLGLPFKDTWFVSPGNSYVSRLIEDAGGEYLWKDTRSTVSMPYGLENVWLRAQKADYWLNIGTVTAKSGIIAVDRRLGELPCFGRGNLYNNNRRTSPGGGNDFWESGSVRPHVILHDIASILHPELFNDVDLFFYRQIL